jgi:hypothetical protein
MDVAKPYKLMWSGDIHGPNPMNATKFDGRLFRGHRYGFGMTLEAASAAASAAASTVADGGRPTSAIYGCGYNL